MIVVAAAASADVRDAVDGKRLSAIDAGAISERRPTADRRRSAPSAKADGDDRCGGGAIPSGPHGDGVDDARRRPPKDGGKGGLSAPSLPSRRAARGGAAVGAGPSAIAVGIRRRSDPTASADAKPDAAAAAGAGGAVARLGHGGARSVGASPRTPILPPEARKALESATSAPGLRGLGGLGGEPSGRQRPAAAAAAGGSPERGSSQMVQSGGSKVRGRTRACTPRAVRVLGVLTPGYFHPPQLAL